jgi:hypothetical protein
VALADVVQIGTARAQQSDDRQPAIVGDLSQSMTTLAPLPGVGVLGVPFGIYAPVASPYSDSAYRTLAGQPATGYSTLAAGSGLTN